MADNGGKVKGKHQEGKGIKRRCSTGADVEPLRESVRIIQERNPVVRLRINPQKFEGRV
jgi:hypothetical protein